MIEVSGRSADRQPCGQCASPLGHRITPPAPACGCQRATATYCLVVRSQLRPSCTTSSRSARSAASVLVTSLRGPVHPGHRGSIGKPPTISDRPLMGRARRARSAHARCRRCCVRSTAGRTSTPCGPVTGSGSHRCSRRPHRARARFGCGPASTSALEQRRHRCELVAGERPFGTRRPPPRRTDAPASAARPATQQPAGGRTTAPAANSLRRTPRWASHHGRGPGRAGAGVRGGAGVVHPRRAVLGVPGRRWSCCSAPWAAAGARLVSRATVPLHLAPILRADVMEVALRAVPGLMRKDAVIEFPDPIVKDGPGWLARINLPHGVTPADVMGKRPALASGLRRPLGCVWPGSSSG